MLSPEEQLEIGRRLREGDRDAWAALYEHYNILLTSKYLDDYSLEEMAAHSESSAKATKSRLDRARREFRAAFGTLVGSDQGARLS